MLIFLFLFISLFIVCSIINLAFKVFSKNQLKVKNIVVESLVTSFIMTILYFIYVYFLV